MAGVAYCNIISSNSLLEVSDASGANQMFHILKVNATLARDGISKLWRSDVNGGRREYCDLESKGARAERRSGRMPDGRVRLEA